MCSFTAKGGLSCCGGASEAAAEGEDLSIPSAAQSLNGLSEIPCVHVFDEEEMWKMER